MEYVEYIKQSPLKYFTRGEVLCKKGDKLQHILAVRTGYVKVTSINDAGIERLLWIAGRYDLSVIEQLFARHGTARFFYTALTDGSYYEVERDDFLRYANSDARVMAEIAKGMAQHYDDFLERVDGIDGANIRERLLKTLLYLAEHFGAAASVSLKERGLRITHQDIANMIGSTRETTSLLLASLRKEGYLSYDRQDFTIHSDIIRAAIE